MATITYYSLPLSPIVIADQGTISDTLISFMSGTVTTVEIGLDGLSHTWPDDIDMLLLGPAGTNLIIMSDVGGSADLVDANFRIADTGFLFLNDGPETSGSRVPTDYTDTESVETGSNFGLGPIALNHPVSAGNAYFGSVFGGTTTLGDWTLYIRDDTANDSGSLDAWNLTLITAESTSTVTGTNLADSFSLTDSLVNFNSQSAIFSGLTGVTFNGGSGTDVLSILGGTNILLAFDGGTEDDTLEINNLGSYSLDLRPVTLTSVEALRLNYVGSNSTAEILLNSTQIGSGLLSSTATIEGQSFNDVTERIVVFVGAAGVDLSGWTLTDFNQPNDRVIINGDANGQTIMGTNVADEVNAGAGSDSISTGFGNDRIDGGADDDEMFGGFGNDVYFVDNVGDDIFENVGEGTDGVVSTITYTLSSFVENIQLIGNANINATGNNDANRLIGNAGNNILNGMGGVDFMQGLGGNDVYWVDSLGESVVEAAGQGIDGVVSTITYTLPVNVENLQLIGSANINATGNALDNRLIGNAGNNVLNGLVGADIMQGLNGNDVYWVDNAGDSIIETSLAGSGIDGVITSVNYTLAVNVENLSLGGASTIGVGNASNNTITGNGLNNVINGMLGYDVLIGGGGDDKFIMNTSITGGPNFDYLKDFNDAGNDEIRLENAIFTALTSTGFLAANLFRDIGTGAQDADDVILYNSTTGALYYDANGLAAGGLTQFAVVDVGTTVTAADFFVI